MPFKTITALSLNSHSHDQTENKKSQTINSYNEFIAIAGERSDGQRKRKSEKKRKKMR